MLSKPSFIAAVLTSFGWAPAALAQAPTEPLPAASPAEPAPPAPGAAPAPALEAPPPANASPPAADQAPPPPAVNAPFALEPEPDRVTRPGKRSRFFAAFQLGGGYFHASSGSDADPRRFSGGTVSGMVAMGGRVGHNGNVALAGAFIRDQVYGLSSHDRVIDGDEPHLNDVTFGLWAVGFLVDYAPEREAGWHFQGLVGLGELSVSRANSDPDDPAGLMASLGAGYDFRVSQFWTVGGLLRATYAPLDSSEIAGSPSSSVSILVPSLLLTATTR